MNEYALDEYSNRIGAKNNVIETLKKLKENGAAYMMRHLMNMLMT